MFCLLFKYKWNSHIELYLFLGNGAAGVPNGPETKGKGETVLNKTWKSDHLCILIAQYGV